MLGKVIFPPTGAYPNATAVLGTNYLWVSSNKELASMLNEFFGRDSERHAPVGTHHFGAGWWQVSEVARTFRGKAEYPPLTPLPPGAIS